MPIYEDVLPIDLMRKLAGNSSCGDCGGVLTVAWSSDKNCYMLRCGNNIEHNTTKPVDLSAEYAEYASKLGWRNKRLQKEIGPSRELALRQYEYLPRLNKEQATEIVSTVWPDAPELERTKAIMVCVQYGLNPLRKHVYLIPFENKRTGKTDFVMVLGINGTRLIAANTIGHYSYQDGTPRVMTDEEQKTTFGAVDPANLCVITKIKVANGDVYPGYGTYPKNTVPYGSDKGNSPFNMACYRSERQAFDRACPGAIPEGIETVDERFMPRITVGEKAVLANPLTGEVVEDDRESERLNEVATAMQEKQPAETQPTASVASQDGLGTPSGTKQVETVVPPPNDKIFIDMEWLNGTLDKLKYQRAVSTKIKSLFPAVVIKDKNLVEILSQLSHEQQDKLVKELRERAESGGITLD